MASPPVTPVSLGDGVLEIGHVGTEIDISCAVNNAKITVSKDQADSTTKLCGTVRQGKITYTYALTGNMDADVGDPDGFFALSQAEPGTEMAFLFHPHIGTTTSAKGTLIIDPLDFGADEMGADLTSDFEFAIVGKPDYDYLTPAPGHASPRDDEDEDVDEDEVA